MRHKRVLTSCAALMPVQVRGSPSAHAMHRAIQRNDLPLLRLLLGESND